MIQKITIVTSGLTEDADQAIIDAVLTAAGSVPVVVNPPDAPANGRLKRMIASADKIEARIESLLAAS